ncbi:bleomycin resistance protein [Rhodocista pekingensis]|uniref:Bleomycin resistance protein n=1 Tax=Rhodocista pekingensis TaxID=201185 RepID=A0ABW2KRF3_9PROT
MARILSLRAELPSPDLDLSLPFYERLGFQLDGRYGDGFALLVREGWLLHLWRTDDPALCRASSIYLQVDDVDGFHAEALAAGVEPFRGPPADRSWGMREVYYLDPAGCLLKVGQETDDDDQGGE